MMSTKKFVTNKRTKKKVSQVNGHYVGLLLVLLLSACQSNSADKETSTPSPKPNFILLFVDDLGYGDLSTYGHPSIHTPNLDKLAAEGQKWTDFYVASPVCSPSRGALLTGREPVRTGLYGRRSAVLFPDDPAGIPHYEVTLAEALKEVGYNTTAIGKWHLGDRAEFLPTRHGFDQWFGIPHSNDMDLITDAAKEDKTAAYLQAVLHPKPAQWNAPLLESLKIDDRYQDRVFERPADQRHLTRHYTKRATDYIKHHSKDSKPFFLYLAYTMPHVPLFRSEAFVGKSNAGLYGDVVEEIDWSVGAIVQALKAQGLDDNTLLVFTSDNGPWLIMKQHGGSSGALRQGKATTFEGGVRVPGIFWAPSLIKPGLINEIGSTMDIFPTFLSLAGATLPQDRVIDGIDQSPVLLSKGQGSRDSLAYYFMGELRAFRKGSYKIHFVTQGAHGQPPERTVHETPLLFHLGEDPGERYDLSAERPDVLDELIEAAQTYQNNVVVHEPIFDARFKETEQ